MKDNTYTFYCVFDSALNQKHNKQKAYPYPPSLRWDFQRKRAVKFCDVDFSEFLSFWKIKNQQNLQQNRTCKVFMLHDWTTRLKFSFTFESRLISFPSFEIDRVNMPEPIIKVRRLKLKINFHASATCLKDLPRGHL